MEIRTNETGLELRENGDGPPTIEGTAIVPYQEGRAGTEFVLYTNDKGQPMLTERIEAGAIESAAKQRKDVIARVHHDDRHIIGRKSAGTVRLELRDDGALGYEVDPPDTQAGRDVVENIRRRDIKGSSFAFRFPARKDVHIEERDDGSAVMTIRKFTHGIEEVSPVVNPAYKATEAAVAEGRSAALEMLKEWRAEQDAAKKAAKQKQADMNREATAALLAAELD